MIKQGFKFLNTLLEFGYYQSVLLFRFSKQVRRAIVILYAIVVMNFPAFWKRFIMRSFPNKNMLQYISALHSSRVVRFINKDIAVSIRMSATFPRMVLLRTVFFIFADPTQFRLNNHGLPTLRARDSALSSPVELLLTSSQIIKASLLFALQRMAIVNLRLYSTSRIAIRAKVLSPSYPIEMLMTISTLNIKHLITKYITTTTISQVVSC